MAKKTDDQKKVTRISASSGKSRSKKQLPTASADKKQKKPRAALAKAAKVTKPLKAPLGYFAGAWYELKQVRWPTRSATWALTVAVLAFSGFFVLFILLLDTGFRFLFEELLK